MDRLSSFKRCWSFLLRLLMALRRSVLQIDKASLLETLGSLKIMNFGYTPSCLQLLRKSMSNFRLFFLYSNFSCFQKSLTVTFPYFRAISLQIFTIFVDSTKLKILWIKATTFFKRHFSKRITSDINRYQGYQVISRITSHILFKHIKKDNKSHIFKHLHSTATCFDSYNSLCFKMIDKANR